MPTRKQKEKRLLLDARKRVCLGSFISDDVIAVNVIATGKQILLEPVLAVPVSEYDDLKAIQDRSNKKKG